MLGHLERMEELSISKKIFKYIPRDRRRVSRPRMRWSDQKSTETRMGTGWANCLVP